MLPPCENVVTYFPKYANNRTTRQPYSSNLYCHFTGRRPDTYPIQITKTPNLTPKFAIFLQIPDLSCEIPKENYYWQCFKEDDNNRLKVLVQLLNQQMYRG